MFCKKAAFCLHLPSPYVIGTCCNPLFHCLVALAWCMGATLVKVALPLYYLGSETPDGTSNRQPQHAPCKTTNTIYVLLPNYLLLPKLPTSTQFCTVPSTLPVPDQCPLHLDASPQTGCNPKPSTPNSGVHLKRMWMQNFGPPSSKIRPPTVNYANLRC